MKRYKSCKFSVEAACDLNHELNVVGLKLKLETISPSNGALQTQCFNIIALSMMN